MGELLKPCPQSLVKYIDNGQTPTYTNSMWAISQQLLNQFWLLRFLESTTTTSTSSTPTISQLLNWPNFDQVLREGFWDWQQKNQQEQQKQYEKEQQQEYLSN